MTTHPKITTLQLMHDDAFRHAFASISRKALPFMAPDAYHTDLLHDAAHAATLAHGERIYILVRSLGTNVYAYPDDALDHMLKTDGRAVLRVMRGAYDSFTTTVLHDEYGTADEAPTYTFHCSADDAQRSMKNREIDADISLKVHEDMASIERQLTEIDKRLSRRYTINGFGIDVSHELADISRTRRILTAMNEANNPSKPVQLGIIDHIEQKANTFSKGPRSISIEQPDGSILVIDIRIPGTPD